MASPVSTGINRTLDQMKNSARAVNARCSGQNVSSSYLLHADTITACAAGGGMSLKNRPRSGGMFLKNDNDHSLRGRWGHVSEK
jgi:hypothetical protein